MRRALRQTSLMVAVGIAVAACGGPPGIHELADGAQSWAATAHFAADRWAHGAVSRKYTVLTLERAASQLEQLATSANKVRDTSETVKRQHALLAAQLTAARHAVAALDSAAAHDDRGPIAMPQQQLATAAAALDSLSTATDKQ